MGINTVRTYNWFHTAFLRLINYGHGLDYVVPHTMAAQYTQLLHVLPVNTKFYERSVTTDTRTNTRSNSCLASSTRMHADTQFH